MAPKTKREGRKKRAKGFRRTSRSSELQAIREDLRALAVALQQQNEQQMASLSAGGASAMGQAAMPTDPGTAYAMAYGYAPLYQQSAQAAAAIQLQQQQQLAQLADATYLTERGLTVREIQQLGYDPNTITKQDVVGILAERRQRTEQLSAEERAQAQQLATESRQLAQQREAQEFQRQERLAGQTFQTEQQLEVERRQRERERPVDPSAITVEVPFRQGTRPKLSDEIPDDQEQALRNVCLGADDPNNLRDRFDRRVLLYDSTRRKFYRTVCDALAENNYSTLFFVDESLLKARLRNAGELGPYTPGELALDVEERRGADRFGEQEQTGEPCYTENDADRPSCPPGTLQCQGAQKGYCYDPDTDEMVSTYHLPSTDSCPGVVVAGKKPPRSIAGVNVWTRQSGLDQSCGPDRVGRPCPAPSQQVSGKPTGQCFIPAAIMGFGNNFYFNTYDDLTGKRKSTGGTVNTRDRGELTIGTHWDANRDYGV